MNQRIKKKSSEIIADNRRRHSPLGSHFRLVAHNLRSAHNVGSLFRSADAFGIHELVLSGYTPSPPDPQIRKTALGADETVRWTHCGDELTDRIAGWKAAGQRIYALEQTRGGTLLHHHRPVSPAITLILGNEVTGIEESILEYVDMTVEIAQFGEKHSLNVSVAAGVALYSFFTLLETSTQSG